MTTAARPGDSRPASVISRRHYARAPVQESLVQVRVADTQRVSLDQLRDIRFVHSHSLEKPVPIVNQDVEVTQAPDASKVMSAARQVGYQFRDSDRHEIVRTELDAFSFHKLAPYTGWEDWAPRVRTAWQSFIAVSKPQTIRRVSVRYVNRLELPPQGELKDYLLTAPDIAPGLPQLLSGYAMQVSLPWTDGATEVVVRQAMISPPRPNIAAILLDIEAGQTANRAYDEESLFRTIEDLHAIENEVFERCITNRTRELIS